MEREDHPIIKKTSLIRVPVRLGQDVFATGKISVLRQDYLIKSMKAFKLITEVHQASHLRICATSAMREAENGHEVMERVRMETGAHIELIEGRAEADLIVSTFSTQDLVREGDCLYIDVGGGSTEITHLRDGMRVKARSFRIGTLRLLQQKVADDEWKELEEWLLSMKEDGIPMVGIGTGGNINRIFKENGLAYGTTMSTDQIRKTRDHIAGFSMEDRILKLRLRPDRADVIIPAADIFLRVMENADVGELFVPKIGLADGIVYNLYMRDRGKERYPHMKMVEDLSP
jgi:exopolyphosphatase/guanosine-5'-triphosphate,3'-diphosphate pyrophosphatase